MRDPLVAWVSPKVKKRQVTWPDRCTAEITTPAAIAWNTRHGKGTRCHLRAKVDYRGRLLCARHAALAALAEIAGAEPEWVTRITSP